MTDELFDYFGKGSKKFEPLDDDLDLPEVAPKRDPDTQQQSNLDSAAATDEPDNQTAEPVSEVAGQTETAFAGDDGFGAGLFDSELSSELPPRQVKSAAAPPASQIAAEKAAQPTSKSKPQSKPDTPVAAKPAKIDSEPVADSDSAAATDDGEGGTWDFLAGMLGIGNKAKGKTTSEAVSQTSDSLKTSDSKPATEETPSSPVEAVFASDRDSAGDEIDSLFGTSDSELDLVGWGDEQDDASETADVSNFDNSSASDPEPPAQSRRRSGRPAVPAQDDSTVMDEDFVEFEVEELTPSSKSREADDEDRPRKRRRRRRPEAAEDENEAPRSRRSRNDEDDEAPSPRRGRRGRGSKDRDLEETTASAEETGTNWDDDDSASASEKRPRRRRSRGRGRSKPQRDQAYADRDESRSVDDLLTDDADLPSFDDDAEQAGASDQETRHDGRTRGSRSRRGRRRVAEDESSDRDEDRPVSRRDRDSVSEDDDAPRRSRRRKPRADRERGGRERGDRESARREKPNYGDVPTWDETIESMIDANIKNHESSGKRRGGGGGGNSARRGGGRRRNNRR